jgi:hypothetical protein
VGSRPWRLFSLAPPWLRNPVSPNRANASWAEGRRRWPQAIRHDSGRVAPRGNRLQPVGNEEKQCLMVHVGRGQCPLPVVVSASHKVFVHNRPTSSLRGLVRRGSVQETVSGPGCKRASAVRNLESVGLAKAAKRGLVAQNDGSAAGPSSCHGRVAYRLDLGCCRRLAMAPVAPRSLRNGKNAIHGFCGEGSLLVFGMSLSRELSNVMLSRSCSRCGSERQNPGIWFRSIRHYTCAECGGLEVLTYDENLELFAKAQLMRPRAGYSGPIQLLSALLTPKKAPT